MSLGYSRPHGRVIPHLGFPFPPMRLINPHPAPEPVCIQNLGPDYQSGSAHTAVAVKNFSWSGLVPGGAFFPGLAWWVGGRRW